MKRALGLSHERVALLSRAKGYPYDVSQPSFAFIAGTTVPLVDVDLKSPLQSHVVDRGRLCTLEACAERRGLPSQSPEGPPMPLLAYGANASIEGLSRKLSAHGSAAVLPVARGTLHDFDIVYSSHISPYGAIPAALQHCPGVRATVHVLVATEAQRRILLATEPNYILALLSNLDLSLELGPRLSSAAAYLTRHGMLTGHGMELALAAVETENRKFPALAEDDALRLARDVAAPGLDLDDFIVQSVRNEVLSRRRTERLKASARPFAYRHWQEVLR